MPEIFGISIDSLPHLTSVGLFFFFLFATFASEDAACLLAGTAVAEDRIGFELAVASCLTGIFIGDVLLYLTGRFVGDRIFENKLVGRFISGHSRLRAARWLKQNAATAVFFSRFVSGLRLPTYLLAGAVRANFARFAFCFFVAAAIWTPLVVGLTAYSQSAFFSGNVIVGLLTSAIVLRLSLYFASFKNRRLFVGRLRRTANWEFWPVQVFYAPIVMYILYLAARFRGLTVFTCSNPGIVAGGFVGESKHEIYHLLQRSEARPYMLSYCLLHAGWSNDKKLEAAEDFMSAWGIDYPVVLKPDAGERGRGVSIVESSIQLKEKVSETNQDLILQEFFDGVEASVFYYRFPTEGRGRIFSVTEKLLPIVVGDGKSNLEFLILNDSRAVCLAPQYFVQNAGRLDLVPEIGEAVRLVSIGTHSRGAVFKDGEWLRTPELESRIDTICRTIPGFYFGRFDIRATSFDDLKAGRNFRIIELNGVTSESTNIYDRSFSLFDAYRILFRQWNIAFRIGYENRKLGYRPLSIVSLFKLMIWRDASVLDRSDGSAVGQRESCA